MTIALRGAGQVASGTAGTCTLDLSSISGLAEGDVVVIFVGVSSVSAASDPVIAGGWTDCGLGKIVNSANTAAARAYYKVMDASPDTSAVISGGVSGDGMCAACFAFDGASGITVTPTSATGSSTNPDPPAITPVEADAAILACGFTPSRDTAPGTITSYTVVDTNNNATRAATVAMGYRILSGGAGVAENPAAFNAWTTAAWIAMTVALRARQTEVFAAPPQLAAGAPAIGQGAYGIVLPAPIDITSTAARLETIPTVSLGTLGATLIASNLAAGAPTLGQPALARIVNATANSLVAGAPMLGQPALAIKVNATANALAAGAPTLGQPALARIVNAAANALAAGAPTIGQGVYGRVIAASSLTAGVPALGAPVLALTIPMVATSFAVPALTLGQPTVAAISNFIANSLVDSPAIVGAAAMAVTVNAAANSISAGVPTLGTPTVAITSILTAASLTSGVRVFGTATVAVTVNAAANSLVAGAPTIGQGVFGQKHTMVANALAVSPPTVGVASYSQVSYDFIAGSIQVAGPIITTPTMVPIVLLVASNLATAPPTQAAATIKQQHGLLANAVAASPPTLGSSTIAQTHVLAAIVFVGSPPTLGTPSIIELYPDLVLMPRVLDGGLDALRTEADTILVLTGTPYSYADAVALAVGENPISFGAIVPATGGRKISSAAVVNGTVIDSGVVHRWAVVDTVNSRLLAHGDLTGDQETIIGTAWTLDPIVIVLPGVP